LAGSLIHNDVARSLKLANDVHDLFGTGTYNSF